jgi:hypothetical protein
MTVGGFLANTFQKTFIWRWFVRRVLPFLTLRLWGMPSYPMGNYFKIRTFMGNNPQELFAFVGRNKWVVNNILNRMVTGARWGHAGILYLDGTGEVRMRHMINTGYSDWSLLDYLRECDGFEPLILPIVKDKKTVALKRIEQIVEEKAKIKYDFDFGLVKALVKILDDANLVFPYVELYCSEYVWLIAYGLTDSAGFEPHFGLGRDMFEPDDVYNACQKIDLNSV